LLLPPVVFGIGVGAGVLNLFHVLMVIATGGVTIRRQVRAKASLSFCEAESI